VSSKKLLTIIDIAHNYQSHAQDVTVHCWT